MDLMDLRYLSIVVETGSFSGAAESLGLNPATISRRIIRLEDELGVTIFERGSFGIVITANPEISPQDRGDGRCLEIGPVGMQQRR